MQICIYTHNYSKNRIDYLYCLNPTNPNGFNLTYILPMLKEERFHFILECLNSEGRVSFEILARELGVSEDTIRRDIETLVKNGLMVKTRGGAIPPSKNPLSFRERSGLFSESKKRIALKAHQLVTQAKTLYLDGGSTVLAIAATIPIDAKIRIITNNIALPGVLSNHAGVELIVLGGNYNSDTQTTLGIQTCLEVQKYLADLFLMGTCAIDPQFGVTAQVAEDGEVKKAMILSSKRTLSLVNNEKLNTTEFFSVTSLKGIDGIITDLESDDRRLDGYRFSGLEII